MSIKLVAFIILQTWKNTTLLLSITSAVLLVLTEILSTKYGKISILVDRTKLKIAAYMTGVLALLSTIILIIIPSTI